MGWRISKRCDDRARQPNESAIPSATASVIWTVTPNATGAAGTSALIPAAVVTPRANVGRVGACRSSIQNNPCYFGNATSDAGNDPVADSFKQRLDLVVGDFFEGLRKFAAIRAEHGFVLLHCCRTEFDR